jgi:sugar lactone lactonase YvrE
MTGLQRGDGMDPVGKLIGRIRLPEVCSNACVGGPKRNRLFMPPANRSTRSTSTHRVQHLDSCRMALRC